MLEWRDVLGWPRYEVSVKGRIRNKETGHVLQLMKNEAGYLYFFPKRGIRLFAHKAVLEAFVCQRPDGCESRHIDGNAGNNSLENLAWGTRWQNAQDKKRHGTLPYGERSGTAKLTEKDVHQIRRLHGSMSLRRLAVMFGVSHTAIRRAAVGIKWRHLHGQQNKNSMD